jgi:phage shock protein PspC (stress-responsive transcriptional regulator)
MNMIELADRAATRIGLGERLMRPIRRHHFRWIPLIAILMAAIANTIHFYAPGLLRNMGWLLMFLAFNQAIYVTVFGPLRRVGLDELPKDEHERLTAMRANLFSLRVMSAAVFAGLTFMVVGSAKQWQVPSTFVDWAMILGFLLTMRLSLVIIHASWVMPPMADDDEPA